MMPMPFEPLEWFRPFFIPFGIALTVLFLLEIFKGSLRRIGSASTDDEYSDDIEEPEMIAAATHQLITCCHCGAHTHGYPCEYCRSIE